MSFWSGLMLLAALQGEAAHGAEDAAASAAADASFLNEAEQACRHEDFSTFLFSFAASDAVQERYSADVVQRSAAGAAVREEEGRTYAARGRFPLRTLDVSYFTRASVERFRSADSDAAQLVAVELEIDESLPPRPRVTWRPGTWAELPDEGESEGRFEQNGAGGTLVFQYKGRCWQLVADIRD